MLAENQEVMNILKDKVVSLTYDLRVNGQEEIVEKVQDENPLKFIFGSGTLLKSFEENLDGLKTGDSFQFVLKPEEAYGPVNEQAISELPKNIFMVNGELREDLIQVGKVVPMRDKNGNRLDGMVTEVKDETIVMDFNHPMAGKELNFSGKVTDVRDATDEELTNGLYGSSCGCDSGCGCDDGAKDDCNSGSCNSGGCNC
jgi:FKBP-type peptidyl-prolyl cis-trans isomerase SlyD